MKIAKSLSLSICSFLLIFFYGCGEQQPIEEILRPVRTKQVFSTGGSRIRTFSGVVQSGRESNLSFKVGGTVEKVNVELGSRVRYGQILAQLDSTDYVIKVGEAEAARDQARAAEIQAERNYERVRSLYENNNASKSDLEAARAAYESAHEQDNIAKKRRKFARKQLEYTQLIAPVNGIISNIGIEENENVGVGRTVMVLTSGSELEVKIAIPEIFIAQIRSGDKVSVSLEAVPDHTFKAFVSEVGIASTGFATTFPVILKFAEISGEVRPGMAAEVSFTFDPVSEVECFFVPPAAVSEDRLGRFVFIVEPSEPEVGIIKKKAVTVGELTKEGLEILAGLEDGEYLVTAGVSKVQENLRVRFNKSGETK